MQFSGMLHHAALVKTEVSEEHITSKLGTMLAVTTNRHASVASYCKHSQLTNSCHPDDGGDMFLQNGSYKSHMV
jgi:hypothetical protein